MLSLELIVLASVFLVVATALFLFLGRVRNFTNNAQDKIKSSLSKVEDKTKESSTKESATENNNTQSNTPKPEVKETQAPTVVNNITNNNNNQYSTVVVNEAQVPVKQENSFMSNLGSNLIAELVVAVLFAGLTWFIKDYVKLRKQHKVNARKEKLDMRKD